MEFFTHARAALQHYDRYSYDPGHTRTVFDHNGDETKKCYMDCPRAHGWAIEGIVDDYFFSTREFDVYDVQSVDEEIEFEAHIYNAPFDERMYTIRVRMDGSLDILPEVHAELRPR